MQSAPASRKLRVAGAAFTRAMFPALSTICIVRCKGQDEFAHMTKIHRENLVHYAPLQLWIEGRHTLFSIWATYVSAKCTRIISCPRTDDDYGDNKKDAAFCMCWVMIRTIFYSKHDFVMFAFDETVVVVEDTHLPKSGS